MLHEFKSFILRGNVIDLAVGIIIGAAFTGIVNSLVTDIIMPPIGYLMAGIDFSTLAVNLPTPSKPVEIKYGLFLNALITFLITAAAIYFFVVMPINTLKERRSKGAEADVEPSNEEKMVALLEQIAAK